MQATLPRHQSNPQTEPFHETRSAHGPVYDLAELHAFFAARNLILREAEENTTELNLRRAAAANDFAESCLPSEAWNGNRCTLSVAEAAQERKRCQAVRVRLAELRVRLRRRAA